MAPLLAPAVGPLGQAVQPETDRQPTRAHGEAGEGQDGQIDAGGHDGHAHGEAEGDGQHDVHDHLGEHLWHRLTRRGDRHRNGANHCAHLSASALPDPAAG